MSQLYHRFVTNWLLIIWVIRNIVLDDPDFNIVKPKFYLTKNFLKLLIPFFFLLNNSCSEKNNYSKNFNVDFETINFKLDSLTLPYLSSIQYIELDSVRFLTFTNKHNRSIYYYNYETNELSKVLKLHTKEGDKINVDGHFIANRDSVYIVDRQQNTIILYDLFSDSVIRYTFHRDKSTFLHPPVPMIGTFNPIWLDKKYILCSGYIYGDYLNSPHGNRPVILIFDKLTKQLTYHINYPDIYYGSRWGADKMYYVYITFAFNNMYVSFPLYNKILEINLVNMEINHIPTTRILKINPSKINNHQIDLNNDYYYFTNYAFGPILYDKYRNFFYRFWYEPAKRAIISDKESWMRSCWIDVFNINFDYLGELLIDDSVYNITNAFITKEGLNFQKFTNDDTLTFSVLKINYYND